MRLAVSILLAAQLLVLGAACKDRSKSTSNGSSAVGKSSGNGRPEPREQDAEYRAKAAPAIQAIEKSLAGKSDEQLIAMLHGDRFPEDEEARRIDYYVAHDGNRMIEQTLRQRGPLARAALTAHVNDGRYVYANAPTPQTVGLRRKALLRELAAVASATPDQKLIIAAFNGDEPTVRKLLAAGASVDARYGDPGQDIFNCEPLSATQWTALIAVAQGTRASDYLGISKLLVEAGASVNLVEDFGRSALHHAVFHDRVDLAQYLLDHGASINARTKDPGATPVFLALHNPAMLDLLLARGADVNIRSDDGRSPLYSAARDRDAETVTKLIKAGADVNAQNEAGETPLHVVGSAAKARLLLAAGARVDLKDRNGFTPLMRVDWSAETIELEHAVYEHAIEPPPGYRGGWNVVEYFPVPDLQRLEKQGLSGGALAAQLNDFRRLEAKEIAEVLKAATGR